MKEMLSIAKELAPSASAKTQDMIDDDGFVPDSTEITEADYDAWVAVQPVPALVVTQLQTEISALSFASLAEAKTKPAAILERLGAGER